MRLAPLAVTEEAQRLLRATHADFSTLTPALFPGRGSGRSFATFGAYSFDQVRYQSEYLRLVSIVEAYIDTCGGQQFDLRNRGRDDFVRNLTAEVNETSLKGWDERKAAFKKYHGVTLGERAYWSDIDAAREVRNSIAHGLGRLTPRQQNSVTKRKMRGVGVSLSGMNLIIGDAAVERCLKSSIAFILDVDRNLKIRR